MDLLSEDGIMNFECVGFSEIDDKAVRTYKSIFNPSSDELEMGDIVKFTSDKNRMESLPQFDFLTGGFPCQTFSMMGKKKGFEEDRGQMFFRIVDILAAKHPQYVLLENVKNLKTHDSGRTYSRIEQELKDLGYSVCTNVFNTSDFHLPQTRSRVLIFATLNDISIQQRKAFTPEKVRAFFDEHYRETGVLIYDNVLDLLEENVPEKYYLSERIKPTILADGSANFKSKSEINKLIARPLTATMHKMHRACQDNYYSKEFIDSHGKVNYGASMDKDELSKQAIRRITPEEAFMLQGFPAEFALKARRNGVADGALYKQAGNAVSVNTIYAVLYFLIQNGLIK